MAGAMSITGDPAGQPTKTGYAVADLFSGLYATIGVLAALRRRDETGRGAWIDCALMDSQVGVLANQAMNYLVSGVAPSRLGNAHPNVVPYEVFPVSDGHVIIAVGNDGQFRRLCAALGDAALGEEAAFASNARRVENRVRLIARITALTLALDRATLLERLKAAAVPAGPINTIADVFADPQVVHRGMRIDRDVPDAAAGTVPGVRTPLMIDGVAQAHDRPAPRVGQHGDEVRRDPAWLGAAS
jgi:crotonobetainyl-CoA:carnitine CoA-transferase CaiB-like acyl-CoA transferase